MDVADVKSEEIKDYGTIYWKHLLKDVELSSNEVYTMCKRTRNSSVCKEMIINFQHLVYDFNNLLGYLDSKENGTESQLYRSSVFTSSKEEIKVDLELPKIDYCERSTQTEFEGETSKSGVNVMAPVFVPTGPAEDEEEEERLRNYEEEIIDEDEEGYFPMMGDFNDEMNGMISPYICSSPDLIGPSFDGPSFSECQPWHFPQQPFTPFSHFHVGNNFIPSSALPFPPMSNVVPYPPGIPTPIVSSLPSPYYFNNNYPQSSFVSYPNSNVLPKNKKKVERRAPSVKSEKSQESKLSNTVNNLSTQDETKLTNVDRDSLNNVKEGIKIPTVIDNISLNKNNNISENLNSSKPPEKDKTPERTSEIIDNKLDNNLKEAPEISILGLSEAERQKQFPELKPDNRLVKKNKRFYKKSMDAAINTTEIIGFEKQTWYVTACSKSKIEETPSFPMMETERNLLPPTYSLVTEKSKSVDPNNKNLVRDCAPKIKKGINIKPETSKKNTVSKKPEKVEKTKVFVQSCMRDANLGKNKRGQKKEYKDGWQTVRYKTRDGNNGESGFVPGSKVPFNANNKSLKSAQSNNGESCSKKISPPQIKSNKTLVFENKMNIKPFTLPHQPINDIEVDILSKGDANESIGSQSESSISHKRDDFMLLTSSFLTFGDSFAIEMTPDEKATRAEGFTEFGPNNHMNINEFFHENNAKDMYSEFMEYLSCIKWAAQVDEISNFATLLAKDSPQSFIDSYSSPSIEHFEEFLLGNAKRALEFRAEISNKYKRLKDTEEKQQQAYEKRQQLLQCKTAKVREFVQKVEEVRAAKYKLALEMKAQIDKKLKKAEENRKLHLSTIKRKAHDEEEKLKEIAFINELEAQNRRHDSLILRQETEERLQCMLEERQRKFEEKAAKDAAVEERRKMLEAERKAKLQEISEKRKKKEENIDLKQQVRKQERQVIAREKAREREERLLAIQAAQIASMEELQKRIQQKQEESARRHEENIELIRQKALEVGLHKTLEDSPSSTSVKPDDQTEIESHRYSYNELIPAFKKRCKKIRSRMISRGIKYCDGLTFEDSFDNCKMSYEVLELNKLINSANFNDKTSSLINSRLITIKELIKQDEISMSSFISNKGFIICSDFLKRLVLADDLSKLALFIKPLQVLTVLLDKLCTVNIESFKYLLLSNDLMLIIDLVQLSFQNLKQRKKRDDWLLLGEQLTSLILNIFNSIKKHEGSDFGAESDLCIQDAVSYVVCSGIVSSIIDMLRAVVIEGYDFVNPLVAPSIHMFSSLICEKFYSDDLSKLLKETDCLETVYLLCESLQKLSANGTLPDFTLSIITMLVKYATVDIVSFQNVLGAEGMSLQIRSIASVIISYCTKNPKWDLLLVAMIKLIGYFSIRNDKNQAVLQSGQQPTVLQLLVTLPFQYFCENEYKMTLFATLLACSYENPINTAVVESELSYETLENFASTCEPGKSALLDIFYKRTTEKEKKKRKKSKKGKKTVSTVKPSESHEEMIENQEKNENEQISKSIESGTQDSTEICLSSSSETLNDDSSSKEDVRNVDSANDSTSNDVTKKSKKGKKTVSTVTPSESHEEMIKNQEKNENEQISKRIEHESATQDSTESQSASSDTLNDESFSKEVHNVDSTNNSTSNDVTKKSKKGKKTVLTVTPSESHDEMINNQENNENELISKSIEHESGTQDSTESQSASGETLNDKEIHNIDSTNESTSNDMTS